MNYAAIKTYDIANGPGVRTVLFVSGCTRHCKDCFQPQTWDFDYGEPFTQEVAAQVLQTLAPLDVLVDGPFVAAQKNLTLRFRGSENQRLIDMKQTLQGGDVVIWDDGARRGGK